MIYFFPLILILTLSLHAEEMPMQEYEIYIEKSMQIWKVPGCAVAVAQEGKVLLAKGFGKKRLSDATDNQVDDETLFPIASISKLFTATLVSQLIDQKKMQWDATIRDYLPHIKMSDSYAQEHLTIGDCLSMHSGLPGLSADDLWFEASASQDEMIAKLVNLPFQKGFRGSFAYQNLLYLLVGKVIEKQEKSSWDEVVKKRILTPLQMTRTNSRFATLKEAINKAYPHQGTTGKEVPFENLDNLAPAAGLISCAKDMGKWLSALTSRESQLAKSAIFSSQCVASPEGFFPEKESYLFPVFFPECQFFTYGYGCFVHDYKGVLICQTPGLSDGMSSIIIFVPKLSLAIAVLTNLESPFFPHAVVFQLLDSYLGKTQDWNHTLFEVHKSHIQ